MSELREGWTTGSCAAAAALAAALCWIHGQTPESVSFTLPGGEIASLPIADCQRTPDGASACVCKDAGDDPDITDGSRIVVTLRPAPDTAIHFEAGEGVGTVTQPGLALAPGEPAINPTPRCMIENAIREVTDRGVIVTVAIPGGGELADKTFNPRLGVTGGLSILGTSGRVRPFSHDAIRETIRCALRVLIASGCTTPILVPGHIGAKAARALSPKAESMQIAVSNAWGDAIDLARELRVERILALGHPGKLVKLIAGDWDTHSSNSRPATETIGPLIEQLTGQPPIDAPTAEGLLSALNPDVRAEVCQFLAEQIRRVIADRLQAPVSVCLIDLQSIGLATAGDMHPWTHASAS